MTDWVKGFTDICSQNYATIRLATNVPVYGAIWDYSFIMQVVACKSLNLGLLVMHGWSENCNFAPHLGLPLVSVLQFFFFWYCQKVDEFD